MQLNAKLHDGDPDFIVIPREVFEELSLFYSTGKSRLDKTLTQDLLDFKDFLDALN